MRYFLANYAVPHPPKKAHYAARCGKFLQNVRPGVVNFSQNVRPGAVNFCKMRGHYGLILCKLCGICFGFRVSEIRKYTMK